MNSNLEKTDQIFHSIRNKLSPIAAYLTISKNREHDEDERQLFEMAQRSFSDLRSLLEGLFMELREREK